MIEVICKQSLYKNRGMKNKIEMFTKGEKYKYLAESSTWNNHLIYPNYGCGQDESFNENEFYKYFKFK